MIALIQRVTGASVTVGPERVGEIGRGILALVGVASQDTPETGARLLEKLLSYRIFPDDAGRMNRDLRQIGGEIGRAHV